MALYAQPYMCIKSNGIYKQITVGLQVFALSLRLAQITVYCLRLESYNFKIIINVGVQSILHTQWYGCVWVCVCARIRFHIEFCRQGLIFVALAMRKDSINKRNVFIIYEIIVCLFGGFSGFAVHFFTSCLLWMWC